MKNIIKGIAALGLTLAMLQCRSEAEHEPQVAKTVTDQGQNYITFSEQAGGNRGFTVSTKKYNSGVANKLVVVFPGTDWKGYQISNYLNKDWYGQIPNPTTNVLEPSQQLEAGMENTVFVYPDPKWREFRTWFPNKPMGGWLLGPDGYQASGMEDIQFTSELIDHITSRYNIDKSKVFATGHSWGGDMAAVCGMFLGDKFRAVMPVSANFPYWFDAKNAPLPAPKNVAVWTVFGKADTYFSSQKKLGAFGYMQNAFWKKYYNVSTDSTMVTGYIDKETYEYGTASNPKLRLTIFSPAKKGSNGHQPPDHYTKMAADWFNSF
jgi:polyhydroxybutyrate depolymerase